jgi:MFS family permease
MASFYSIVWNTTCGLAQSKTELIIFRFLAGIGGSAPTVISGAVIGDVFDPENRGTAMSIYSIAPLLGPAIGYYHNNLP